jgi:hypothetical protein
VRFGEACIVKRVPEHPVCVENYREYPPLGRFIVRDSEKNYLQLESSSKLKKYKAIFEILILLLF